MVLAEKFRVSDDDLQTHISVMRSAERKEKENAREKDQVSASWSISKSSMTVTTSRSPGKSKEDISKKEESSTTNVKNSFALVWSKFHGKCPFKLNFLSRNEPICPKKRNLIRIYVTVKMTSDCFWLWVSPQMPVGPTEDQINKYERIIPSSPRINAPATSSSCTLLPPPPRPASSTGLPPPKNNALFKMNIQPVDSTEQFPPHNDSLFCSKDEGPPHDASYLKGDGGMAGGGGSSRKNLKSMIEEVLGIPVGNQILMHEKHRMTLDEMPLELYNIRHGSTISLAVDSLLSRSRQFKSSFLASTRLSESMQQEDISRWSSMSINLFKRTHPSVWMMPKWKSRRNSNLADKFVEKFATALPETLYYDGSTVTRDSSRYDTLPKIRQNFDFLLHYVDSQKRTQAWADTVPEKKEKLKSIFGTQLKRAASRHNSKKILKRSDTSIYSMIPTA